MLIDLILDRKDGIDYSPKEFYEDCMAYEQLEVADAMDCKTEQDVKNALCKYIDENDYNPEIKKYINSQSWLMEE